MLTKTLVYDKEKGLQVVDEAVHQPLPPPPADFKPAVKPQPKTKLESKPLIGLKDGTGWIVAFGLAGILLGTYLLIGLGVI
jgi:hypothetical protein